MNFNHLFKIPYCFFAIIFSKLIFQIKFKTIYRLFQISLRTSEKYQFLISIFHIYSLGPLSPSKNQLCSQLQLPWAQNPARSSTIKTSPKKPNGSPNPTWNKTSPRWVTSSPAPSSNIPKKPRSRKVKLRNRWFEI